MNGPRGVQYGLITFGLLKSPKSCTFDSRPISFSQHAVFGYRFDARRTDVVLRRSGLLGIAQASLGLALLLHNHLRCAREVDCRLGYKRDRHRESIAHVTTTLT